MSYLCITKQKEIVPIVTQKLKNMASWENNAKVGQYFYAPHRSCTGVWVVEYKSDTCMSSRFVKNFAYREDAKAYVYQMNGWTKATA